MRGSYLVLSAVVASLLVACSGGNPAPPVTNTTGAFAPSAHLTDSGIRSPRFLRLMHTPNHPPARRHRVTAAMRARARAGGWQQLSSTAAWTNGPDTPMLMTDGTVMVHDYCTSNWYSLAPDQSGNYNDGTWTKMASMPSSYAPLYFASAVLPDGKLIANGGEYNGATCQGVETNLGAIYDPVKNAWTAVSAPSGWAKIGDGQSAVLPNGTYMLGNCCYSTQALLNEKQLSWTQSGPSNGKQDENSEEGWALLPSGNLLDAEVADAPSAQLYNATSNMWVPAGQTPVNLTAGFEIGPSTLRPNGTVFVAGANGYSAIYTANSGSGSWVQGPTFPNIGGQQYDVADGPSSVLTNGQVMIPASPGLYNTPTLYYLFNGKKLKNIAAPPNAPNDSTYNTRLLLLPTGQILEVDGSTDIELYTAGSNGGAGTAPDITKVSKTLSPGNTYKITGHRFNGMTQNNMYGDDAQEASNFPLVRITNNASGHVVYCRTHGTSFMGVASNRKVSTMFDVPSSIGTGASTLVVVANGVASRPVSVTIQ
jgi:hypothetical protein